MSFACRPFAGLWQAQGAYNPDQMGMKPQPIDEANDTQSALSAAPDFGLALFGPLGEPGRYIPIS